ncbi:MAG TPA: PilZ domain-containing protein [Vicinamibacterales bacterium]
MTVQERRKHPRVNVPIDGQWRATSTGSFCRVVNVSMGGCFARTPNPPAAADDATLTMYFGKHGPLSIKGKVVHAAPKTGFGFAFDAMHHVLKLQLGQHLESLKVGDY